MLNLTENGFALCNNEEFVDDVRLWPPFEFAHISARSFSHFAIANAVTLCTAIQEKNSVLITTPD